MNNYSWLIRREFWENRAIWMFPAVLGGLLLLAALFSKIELMSLPAQIPSQAVGQAFLGLVGAIFFAVMAIYSTWYLLDCLYADRKDRSVLFWKSLPISDAATVLCKLAVAIVIIPLVYAVAADLTTLLMAFIISVRASSFIGGALWHGDAWLQLQGLWLYLIFIAAVWFLPLSAYLMVVSAWAKRAVMLWSILPPLALVLAERLFVGTHVIASVLAGRLVLPVEAFNANPGSGAWVTTVIGHDTIRTPSSIWSFLNIGGFLSSPETWIGVAIGVVLIICAIQLRMRRTEI
jgi:ABC-2 type transport system permease protein